MKKVLTIFGTRPEAIKMAPVVKELEKHSDNFVSRVCVTAQHRQMLDQVLEVFDIKPDYDLDLMKPDQDLTDVTCAVLRHLKEIIQQEKPDIVLVQGDTTTCMAASLAAFYNQTPIGHIEAGLRTCKKYAPFPEEINRQITSRLADLHFAPTEKARENLLEESIPDNSIYVTGNTVIDALLEVVEKNQTPQVRETIENDLISSFPTLKNVLFQNNTTMNKRIILVTGHRRENFGPGFVSICEALKQIALEHSNVQIIYPVHLNPQVQEPVNRILQDVSSIHLIEPLDYQPFVYLLERSCMVITDSGGIQEEAPSLGKPVLVMRDTTERPEAVEAGTAKLVGTITQTIVTEVTKLLTKPTDYERMSMAYNPYGEGEAAVRIIEAILNLNQQV